MNIAIIRFLNSDWQVRIGVSDVNGVTYALATDSISELLAKSLAEIRKVIEDSLDKKEPVSPSRILAPIDNLTEVWAAGVTYKRSKIAREEESDHADFYSRVYNS